MDLSSPGPSASGPVRGLSRVRIEQYRCPILHGPMWDIWIDHRPLPALSIYLRSESRLREWEPTTRAAIAYRLVHVARWLERRGSLSCDSPIFSGGEETVQFREHLRSLTDVGQIAETTADKIMGDLLGVAVYWGLIARPRRGKEKRPPAFRFKIRKNPSFEGEKSLSRDEISRVWDFLERAQRPDRRRSRIREALWARDLILWATFISTGIRAREALGLLVDDVIRSSSGRLWLKVVDPRTSPAEPWRMDALEWGARYKTGSRIVPIWFETRFAYAWRQWIRLRPVLIKRSGRRDPRALLLSKKAYGAPLGPNASRYFTDALTERMGPFMGDSLSGTTFHLTPHRLRHTLTTVLRSEGVQEEVIQASLGHTRGDTTSLYGTIYQDQVDKERGTLAEWSGSR